MMLTRYVPVAAIEVGERLRALDPAWVALLAEEIAAEGQHEPIRVVARGNGFLLVAGARRLAAAIRLGHDEIEARIIAEAELPAERDVRLAEIKADMMRGRLTLLERARYVAAWREAYEALNPPPKRGRPRKDAVPFTAGELSTKRTMIFTEAAQDALDLCEKSVYHLLKIATIAPEAARLIACHPIADRRDELLRLSEEEPSRQKAIAAMLTAEPPEARTVEEAAHKIDGTPSRPAPTEWERTAELMAALSREDREQLYEAREAEILEWYERHKSGPRLRLV